MLQIRKRNLIHLIASYITHTIFTDTLSVPGPVLSQVMELVSESQGLGLGPADYALDQKLQG